MWVACVPGGFRVENTEKCCRYFEPSFFGSGEGQSGFTVFYEPQAAPRRPNEGLADLLLPRIMGWERTGRKELNP